MFDYAIYLEKNGPFKTGIGGLDKQTWLIFYECGYCDSSFQKFNEKMLQRHCFQCTPNKAENQDVDALGLDCLGSY